MPSDVYIVGTGMTTAVGVGTRQTQTSVRSGLALAGELPWMDSVRGRFVMASLPDDSLPSVNPKVLERAGLTCREVRLLRLAQPALEEAQSPLAQEKVKLPLFLGLPELQTQLPIKHQSMLELLNLQAGSKLEVQPGAVLCKGRAASLLALSQAAEFLAGGRGELALAGGTDTFRDLHVLGTLDRDRRLNSSDNVDGFVPGEGAGFLLLATKEAANRFRLPLLACVRAVATGFESGHRASQEPYRGEGLAEVIQKLFSQTGPVPPVQMVFSSMNGENYWAKEWGVSVLRNKKSFADTLQMVHPADCFGDTGAACGALLAGLASNELAARPDQSPALVYSSSDLGDRAAVILEAANKRN